MPIFSLISYLFLDYALWESQHLLMVGWALVAPQSAGSASVSSVS